MGRMMDGTIQQIKQIYTWLRENEDALCDIIKINNQKIKFMKKILLMIMLLISTTLFSQDTNTLYR